MPARQPLLNFRMRLALGASALAILITALATYAFARHAIDSLTQAQARQGQSISQALMPSIREAVTNYRLLVLERTLNELPRDPAIGHIRIVDATGVLLYERSHEVTSATGLARFFQPSLPEVRQTVSTISDARRPLGRLEIGLADEPLNHVSEQALLYGAAIALLLALLSFVLTGIMLTRFTAPLQPLTEWARGIARGNWKPRIRTIDSRDPEIQELSQALNDGSTTMRHYMNSMYEARDLLEHSENRLHQLINGMHDILLELDTEGCISFLNPAWETLTGFKVEDSIGKLFSDFIIDDDFRQALRPQMLPSLHEKNRKIALRTADNRHLWVRLEAEARKDSAGNTTGIIGTLGDITRNVELNHLLSRYQDELYQMSVTDPLTGLYNRRHFDTQLEVILADHLPKNQSVCLLMIDLDGFKFINDTYGHPFGDEVLRATAQLLEHEVRRNDYIARLAGDEFAMVIKKADLASATRIAQKLHTKINQARIPLPVGHMQMQSSIGIAEAPTHGKNAQDLVSAADVALYHSKRRGRNRIEVLSPDISRAMMSIFSQGFELRNALEQGNIHPAFQPICNMENGEPVAYEVLARMQLNGVVIQAKDFIAVAEELGLTRDVDLHIIRAALDQTPTNRALFLNVDLSSFNDRDFVGQLRDLLKPACDSGRSITIEITERETIPLSDTLHDDIQSLRALGCKLALDDFGSGYSTYNFLNQFRPDYLKIEGSFVRGMLDNEADRKIVAHIHDLATSFGMETIAESVENKATQLALRAIGIRSAQGLFYGAPSLPA